MKNSELPQSSRNTDPATSHMAEREITESGVRENHLMRVIGGVERFIGYTASELAQVSTLTRDQIGKRLSDGEAIGALKKGEPRKSRVTGRMESTWYPDKDDHHWNMEILKRPSVEIRIKKAVTDLGYSSSMNNEVLDAINLAI